MTKEQEEAIENLKGMLEYKRQVYNMNTMRNEIVPTLYDIDRKAIETVLSMLKENSAELAEKNAEIEKKDKQIDLMAEFLGERDLGYYKNETGGEIFGIMRQYNKEDWKKYFERKSEEWKK